MRGELPLSAAEIAAMFGVPERLVVQWARTGRIATYHRTTGRKVYLPSDVRRLVDDPRR